MTPRDRITGAGLRTVATDLAIAGLFVLFALAHARSYAAHPRVSVLLMIPFEALFAFFLLVRRPAAEAETSLAAWVSTTVGSFGSLLLRPAADASDLVAAQVLQVTGVALALTGLLSLNRSVGLLPANRGIRRSGAYRIVRHPLYASYTLVHAGYVASNLTWRNVAIAVAVLVAQLWRIHGEEQLLSRDPEYVAYRAETRWKLVPFLF